MLQRWNIRPNQTPILKSSTNQTICTGSYNKKIAKWNVRILKESMLRNKKIWRKNCISLKKSRTYRHTLIIHLIQRFISFPKEAVYFLDCLWEIRVEILFLNTRLRTIFGCNKVCFQSSTGVVPKVPVLQRTKSWEKITLFRYKDSLRLRFLRKLHKCNSRYWKFACEGHYLENAAETIDETLNNVFRTYKPARPNL